MNAPVSLPESSRLRADGWTPDRRRLFLEAISAGHTVQSACAGVGMSKATAYALRNRDPGFALGWSGASLRARDAIADELTGRVLDGQVETWTLPDGTEGKRLRYDNRLALAMLTRLDRLAEQQKDERYRIEQPAAEAARGVAHDFGGFLDLIEQDAADTVTVERFVDARIRQLRQLSSSERLRNIERMGDGGEQPPSAREEALAASLQELLDALDEEEAAQAEAEAKAEAAGTGAGARVGAAKKIVDETVAEPCKADEDATPRPDLTQEVWSTIAPPPAGFHGYQAGKHGEVGYWRTLTPAEHAAAEAARAGPTEAPAGSIAPDGDRPAMAAQSAEERRTADEQPVAEPALPKSLMPARYRRPRIGIA